MKAPIRILFNDSHVNMPSSRTIAQGGPGRFSNLFTSHFQGTAHHLISVFFSHNPNDETIGLRAITSKKQHDYFEIFYPREKMSGEFSKKYTKKEFLQYIAPWIEQVEKLFDIAQPTVLFLNGYGITNYMLFAVAKKRKIPVCIQHAGIWKKELMMNSGSTFSPSIGKIFAGFEKEVVNEGTHQVFLNTFSRDAFLTLHNLELTDLINHSVIPLPIPQPEKVLPVVLKKASSKKRAIGAVSRWDVIKNQSALLRLAEYIKEHKLPAVVSVVTNPFNGIASSFRDRYVASINVVAPMNPKKLSGFYRSADIVLLPSHFDVSPTVLMESLLQGVPVIISDQVGWVSDYKSLGLMDLVIRPDISGEALFAVIERVFNNPERYEKKLNTLQHRILKQHLPELVLPKYEKLFITLSKKHHG